MSGYRSAAIGPGKCDEVDEDQSLHATTLEVSPLASNSSSCAISKISIAMMRNVWLCVRASCCDDDPGHGLGDEDAARQEPVRQQKPVHQRLQILASQSPSRSYG